MSLVAVRRRHVLHAGVIIAVLLQLGFAAAFFVRNTNQTNRTYDAFGHAPRRGDVSPYRVRLCGETGPVQREQRERL